MDFLCVRVFLTSLKTAYSHRRVKVASVQVVRLSFPYLYIST